MPRLDHVPSTNWRPSEMRSCWGSSSYAPRVRRPLLHRKLRLALREAAQSESIFETENGMADVLVIGAGPAGMIAALCAGGLGARVALVARTEFGGMATNDGPVPVRTLSQGARLIREARELGRFGGAVSESVLDYRRLLARVREVVDDVNSHVAVRQRIDAMGVIIHARAGTARFADSHSVITERGLRGEADKIIICSGA